MRHPYETEPPGAFDLDEALEETFPASDPLARWSGIDWDLRGEGPGNTEGTRPTR